MECVLFWFAGLFDQTNYKDLIHYCGSDPIIDVVLEGKASMDQEARFFDWSYFSSLDSCLYGHSIHSHEEKNPKPIEKVWLVRYHYCKILRGFHSFTSTVIWEVHLCCNCFGTTLIFYTSMQLHLLLFLEQLLLLVFNDKKGVAYLLLHWVLNHVNYHPYCCQ